MIRILHIVGTMNVGGAETWLMHVLRHIDRQKFQMDFCCLSGEPGIYAPEIESLGSRVFPCKLTKNLFSFNKRFKKILRAGRYHVVHSHVHHFSGYVLCLAASEGIPIRISHSHITNDGKKNTTFRKFYRKLQGKWIYRYATYGLGASSAAAAALFGPTWQSDNRFQILRCAIDLKPFRVQINPAALRAGLAIPPYALVVGHVGRFDEQKNHLFLVDIVTELAKRSQKEILLMVGDGPLRPIIKEKVVEAGLEDRIIFAGVRSDVPNLMMGVMDLFCMPSLYEGLPVAAIEAQAAGLRCVISTDVTPEVDIVPGAVSFLPRSAGAAAWAEVICQKMKAGRIDAANASEAIRNKGFDVESSLESLMRLYIPAEHADRNS